MGDEYTETKVRYYSPKKKKDGGKFERFVVKPAMRVFNGMKSHKKERLTA